MFYLVYLLHRQKIHEMKNLSVLIFVGLLLSYTALGFGAVVMNLALVGVLYPSRVARKIVVLLAFHS